MKLSKLMAFLLLFTLYGSPLLSESQSRPANTFQPLNLELTARFRQSVDRRFKLSFDMNRLVRVGIERNFEKNSFINEGVRVHLGFSEEFEGFQFGKSSPARLLNHWVIKRLSYIWDSEKKNASSLLWTYTFYLFTINLGYNIGGSAGGIAPYGGYNFGKNRPNRFFTHGIVSMGRFYMSNDGDAYTLGYKFSIGSGITLHTRYRLKSDYETFYENHGVDYSRFALQLDKIF